MKKIVFSFLFGLLLSSCAGITYDAYQGRRMPPPRKDIHMPVPHHQDRHPDNYPNKPIQEHRR